MSVFDYLNSKNITDFEGNSDDYPYQTMRLQKLSSNIAYQHIMEIGFNAGNSANTFLSQSLAHLTSFDLNVRESVSYAKEYIDRKFPGRHTLILGDSTQTIPKFIEENPTMKFDMIFIDGGHTYEIAKADLENCRKLAHDKTLLIVDDVVLDASLQAEWSVGPVQAWADATMRNMVVSNGADIYGPGRGMVWGHYT